MKKLIYLASPYSSEDPGVILSRVKAVQGATAKLIEQGNLIFSPIVHSHPIADLVSFSPINTQGQGADGMSGWMDYDRAMIDKADEVWVLCLPGWMASRGVAAEIEHARKTGTPLKLIDYPSLIGSGSPEPEKAPGAGNFYSPQSTGKAPIFLGKETHTSYANKCPDCAVGIPAPQCKCWDCFHKQMDEQGTKCCSAKCPVHGDKEFVGGSKWASLPDDPDERNGYPMADGLLYYFPNALAEVSKISQIGNEQHNPGEPMHWSRSKSTDHANKIIRHLVDAGHDTEAAIAHAANLAWRSLALLQEKIEQVRSIPLPKNARFD